jgi:hypothetical protein
MPRSTFILKGGSHRTTTRDHDTVKEGGGWGERVFTYLIDDNDNKQ